MFAWVFALALSMFSSRPDLAPALLGPPPPEHVMWMPEALRADVRREVGGVTHSQEKRLALLVRYLFDPEGLGMRYQYDATYTIEQAYQTRAANCLTFTLLTVALAREVGLDAYAQNIAETLIWRQEDNLLYRTTHVNAGVHINQQRFTVDVASDRVLARNPPKKIADNRLLAQYYNNRSAELLAAGALLTARAHAEQSLRLDPNYATSWNNAGVVLMRSGASKAAEQHYHRALLLEPLQPSALSNLAAYYQRIGQPAQAIPLQERLDLVQQRNPFHQFLLAVEFERQGDLAQAVTYYRRAIRLYDGEHRFHFGLARTYYLMGKPKPAGRELARARELSEGSTRSLYQAKLNSLRQQQKS